MRSMDDYSDVNLKILCQEAAELEWINKALAKQINNNTKRLAEIDKILTQHIEDGKNEAD